MAMQALCAPADLPLLPPDKVFNGSWIMREGLTNDNNNNYTKVCVAEAAAADGGRDVKRTSIEPLTHTCVLDNRCEDHNPFHCRASKYPVDQRHSQNHLVSVSSREGGCRHCENTPAGDDHRLSHRRHADPHHHGGVADWLAQLSLTPTDTLSRTSVSSMASQERECMAVRDCQAGEKSTAAAFSLRKNTNRSVSWKSSTTAVDPVGATDSLKGASSSGRLSCAENSSMALKDALNGVAPPSGTLSRPSVRCINGCIYSCACRYCGHFGTALDHRSVPDSTASGLHEEFSPSSSFVSSSPPSVFSPCEERSSTTSPTLEPVVLDPTKSDLPSARKTLPSTPLPPTPPPTPVFPTHLSSRQEAIVSPGLFPLPDASSHQETTASESISPEQCSRSTYSSLTHNSTVPTSIAEPELASQDVTKTELSDFLYMETRGTGSLQKDQPDRPAITQNRSLTGTAWPRLSRRSLTETASPRLSRRSLTETASPRISRRDAYDRSSKPSASESKDEAESLLPPPRLELSQMAAVDFADGLSVTRSVQTSDFSQQTDCAGGQSAGSSVEENFRTCPKDSYRTRDSSVDLTEDRCLSVPKPSQSCVKSLSDVDSDEDSESLQGSASGVDTTYSPYPKEHAPPAALPFAAKRAESQSRRPVTKKRGKISRLYTDNDEQWMKKFTSAYKGRRMSIPDPNDQRLNWTKPPLSVLIIRKHLDNSVLLPFRDLVIWLVEEKNMLVYVEQKVLADGLLLDDKDFEKVQHKLKPFKEGIDDLTDKVDFIICLGGDGTLLYVSSLFQGSVPPVMAFNMGSLGFLTPFQFSQDFKQEVSRVMQGAAPLLLRYRLKCVVVKHETGGPSSNLPHVKNIQKEHKLLKTHKLVLNEVVLDRGPSSYLSNLDLYIEGRRVTTVQGDGLIISTPTGSTAYAVSAGASMIHPSVPCILLTPICPHSLSFRPIVVPAGVEIKVMLNPNSRGTAMVSFDGRDRQEIHQGDSLRITTAAYPVPSICGGDQIEDWFDGLAVCLNWNIRAQQRPLLRTPSLVSLDSVDSSTDLSHTSPSNGYISADRSSRGPPGSEGRDPTKVSALNETGGESDEKNSNNNNSAARGGSGSGGERRNSGKGGGESQTTSGHKRMSSSSSSAH